MNNIEILKTLEEIITYAQLKGVSIVEMEIPKEQFDIIQPDKYFTCVKLEVNNSITLVFSK